MPGHAYTEHCRHKVANRRLELRIARAKVRALMALHSLELAKEELSAQVDSENARESMLATF